MPVYVFNGDGASAVGFALGGFIVMGSYVLWAWREKRRNNAKVGQHCPKCGANNWGSPFYSQFDGLTYACGECWYRIRVATVERAS